MVNTYPEAINGPHTILNTHQETIVDTHPQTMVDTKPDC